MFRKLVGHLLIYIITTIIVVGCVPLLITRNGAFLVMKIWSRSMLYITKKFWGITVSIENMDKIPEKGGLLACKHQSTLEIIALAAIVKKPIFFLKSSLLYIPFLNLYIFRTGQLAVRRWVKNNSRLFGQACQRLKDCNIIIFPEGTRVSVGDDKDFKGGVVILAKQANVPIIPISTNTGVFSPRRSLDKYAGNATLRVLDPIMVTNLKTDLQTLQQVINDDSKKLAAIVKVIGKVSK